MPFAARCHSTHSLPTVWRRSLFLASFGPLSAAIQPIRALPLALAILRAYARKKTRAYTLNLLGWRVRFSGRRRRVRHRGRYALGEVQLLPTESTKEQGENCDDHIERDHPQDREPGATPGLLPTLAGQPRPRCHPPGRRVQRRIAWCRTGREDAELRAEPLRVPGLPLIRHARRPVFGGLPLPHPWQRGLPSVRSRDLQLRCRVLQRRGRDQSTSHEPPAAVGRAAVLVVADRALRRCFRPEPLLRWRCQRSFTRSRPVPRSVAGEAFLTDRSALMRATTRGPGPGRAIPGHA